MQYCSDFDFSGLFYLFSVMWWFPSFSRDHQMNTRWKYSFESSTNPLPVCTSWERQKELLLRQPEPFLESHAAGCPFQHTSWAVRTEFVPSKPGAMMVLSGSETAARMK